MALANVRRMRATDANHPIGKAACDHMVKFVFLITAIDICIAEVGSTREIQDGGTRGQN